MNKKIVALFLALTLCLTAVSALAATNSKTTNNVVTTEKTPVTVVAPTATSEAELAEIAAFVNGGGAVVDFFGDDAKNAILEELPDVDASTLKMDELFPISLSTKVSGPATITLSTAATYKADAKVTVLAGVKGADGKVKWVVLKTRIVDGKLVVDLPADLIAQMAENSDVVLSVLSNA